MTSAVLVALEQLAQSAQEKERPVAIKVVDTSELKSPAGAASPPLSRTSSHTNEVSSRHWKGMRLDSEATTTVHKKELQILKKAITQEKRFREAIMRPLFSNCHAESLLLIVGAALLAMGLGGKGGVPLGFMEGELLFIPELFVMVTGCAFAQVSGKEVMHSVHQGLDCVWVFGSIVLFGMIGSKMTASTFGYIPNILPIIAVGVTARFIGIFSITALTLPLRSCPCAKCYPANKAMIWADAAFYFLCVMAKASVQGALGAVPVQEHFFSYNPAASEVQSFISNAAKLYIMFFAILGMVALELLGPRLLRYSQRRNTDLAACLLLADAFAKVERVSAERALAEATAALVERSESETEVER